MNKVCGPACRCAATGKVCNLSDLDMRQERYNSARDFRRPERMAERYLTDSGRVRNTIDMLPPNFDYSGLTLDVEDARVLASRGVTTAEVEEAIARGDRAQAELDKLRADLGDRLERAHRAARERYNPPRRQFDPRTHDELGQPLSWQDAMAKRNGGM